MTAHRQVNVRVPMRYKNLIVLAGRMLREDPSFAARLHKMINDGPSAAAMADMMDRLEKVERYVRGVAELAGSSVTEPDAVEEPPVADEFAFSRGEGMSRRLTQFGKLEVLRLHRNGTRATQIAAVVGVSQQAIDQFISRHKAREAA